MPARPLLASSLALVLLGTLACSKDAKQDDAEGAKAKSSKQGDSDDPPAKKKKKPKKAAAGDDDEAPAATRACTPGKQESCSCLGGVQGVQICKDDGSGLGKCECPEVEESDLTPAPTAAPTPVPTAKPAPKVDLRCSGEETPCPLGDRRYGWCKSGLCFDTCGRGKTYVALDASCRKPCTKSCSNCQDGGCLD